MDEDDDGDLIEEEAGRCAPDPSESLLLQETLAKHGAPLTHLPPRSRAWLALTLDSAEGTAALLSSLQTAVDAPAFLARLGDASSPCAPPLPCEPLAHAPDVTRAAWWAWTRPKPDSAAQAEALLAQPPEPEPEPLTAYVLVEREDVVEALALFIARFVASHPQAAHLSPDKLRSALSSALADVRKSRCRRLWDWSKSAHRWGVWCYGAATLYSDPWVIKAVCTGLWTAARLAGGLL